jgi:hypothetical protein
MLSNLFLAFYFCCLRLHFAEFSFLMPFKKMKGFLFLPGMSSKDLIEMNDEMKDQESIPVEFFKFSLIDDIIGSFFEKRPVASLLSDLKRFTVDDGVHLTYKFKGQTYAGALRVRSYLVDEQIQQVLIVHMSHDGFRYTKRALNEFTAVHEHYHDRGGWQSLSEQFLVDQDLRNLRRIISEARCEKVDVRYNYPHKRIDMLIFRDGAHILTLCFEHGSPQNSSADQYAVSLRLKKGN